MTLYEKLHQHAEGLIAGGQPDKALEIWDRMICDTPDRAEAYYGLGTCLAMIGRDGGAIAALNHAISLAPSNPNVWVQYGMIMRRNQHPDASRHCFQQALKIAPDHARALTGLAGSYVNMGDPAKGIQPARKALKLVPDLWHAHNDLALLLLETGQWAEGWKEYGHRGNLDGYHVRDYGPVEKWTGERVRCLALHPEQGLGDEILFASCLPDLLGLKPGVTHDPTTGPHPHCPDEIVCEVNPRLLDFFRRSFPTVRFYGTHDEVMKAEYTTIEAWDRLGDLAQRFRPSPDACPGLPYMKADPAATLGYRARLEALGPPPYLGLAWHGGTPATHEAVRNAPLEQWKKILDGPGTKISVQYGEHGQRFAPRLGLPHWQAAIDNIDELIALTAALDGVISVCQTQVHIAGSLGIPCLVVCPSRYSWQFAPLFNGDPARMAWYRSVALYRQPGLDWAPVFDRLAADIAETYAAVEREEAAA